MGLTKPEWLDDSIMRKIVEVAELQYDMIFASNSEIKRLAGGPIIRTFIENINKSVSDESSKKLYLYSGHDDNVASFTKAHGFNKPSLPDYGSALILEKLKDPKTGKVYLKVSIETNWPRYMYP